MPRSNPTSVEILGINESPAITTNLQQLIEKIKDAAVSLDDWGEKQKRYTKLRYEVQRDTKKQIPWKGASNLNVPLIDKTIRRWKPAIVRLVTESDPVAFFFPTEPNDIETARVAEQFYNWLFKWSMDALEEVVYLADIVAHRGTAFVEVGWEYRTERVARVVRLDTLFPDGPPMVQVSDQLGAAPTEEIDERAVAAKLIEQYDLDPNRPDHEAAIMRALDMVKNGETVFKIVYRRVINDRPAINAIDPLQVVVSARETDVANTDFICIRNIFTRDKLRKMALDGQLNRKAVENVIRIVDDRIAQDREGVGGGDVMSPGHILEKDEEAVDEYVGILQTFEDKENLEVWKIYAWLDTNKDGEKERAVFWYHPSTKTSLALTEYAMPFARWPIVRFDFEKTHSRRVYSSRGVPNMLHDLALETNALHNARLDAIRIQLAPVFAVRNPGNLVRNLRWAPGGIIPVKHPDDIRPLSHDLRNLQQYFQEEQFTRLLAEDYVGVFDATLGPAVNPSASRTATEVEAVQAQLGGIFSLDAQIWQKAWRDVHALTFAIWRELGEEQVFIRVTGRDEPLQVRKADIDRQYDIQPAGTPSSTNKAMELARSREMMQLLMNPFTMQSGLINFQKLLEFYVSAHDFNKAKLIVNSEEQATEQQVILQAAQQISGGGLDNLLSNANSVSGQQAGRNSR